MMGDIPFLQSNKDKLIKALLKLRFEVKHDLESGAGKLTPIREAYLVGKAVAYLDMLEDLSGVKE